MKTVFHTDSGLIERFERDAENGRMMLWARVRHIGALQYFDENGNPYEEYVTEDSIADPEFVNGMLIIPVTDDHPSQFINDSNRSRLAKGYTGSQPVIDNESFLIDFSVFDRDLMDKIEKGKRDVSLGYKSLVAFNEEKKRLDQIKCKPNHMAVVDEGRAPRASIVYSLRADSTIWTPKPRSDMKTISVDGKPFEVEDAVADYVNDMATKVADAAKFMEANKAKEKELAKADARIEELEKKVKEAPKRDALESELMEEMSSRFEVLIAATRFGLETKLDAKTDSVTLKKEFVKGLRPEAKLEGRGKEYIEGRYDTLIEQLEAEMEKEDQDLIDREEEEDEEDEKLDNTVSGFYRATRDSKGKRKDGGINMDAFEKYRQDMAEAHKK